MKQNEILTFTLTFRVFSRCFCPKRLTITTTVIIFLKFVLKTYMKKGPGEDLNTFTGLSLSAEQEEPHPA